MMKVVLTHDWLTGYRGGERVLEAFCEMFPDAPLYTLIHKKGSVPSSIEDRKITTSFLDNIPGIYNHYRKFLPLFPLAASSLKIIEDADIVLSSSHCVIKGVKKPNGSKHISYVHSPMRYLYDQFDNYFGADSPFYQRLGMKCFRSYLTDWDINSNDNVDALVGNSAFVCQRMTKYYNRESVVIHPFVDLDDFKGCQENDLAREDYYLMVTAFAPNKKVDLAIEAFNKMGKRLKIIGGGQDEKRLRLMAGDNIEFLGNVNREGVIDAFSKSKAFIFPGTEDFGITPLESLATGTPVIAYKIGGVLETLNDKVAHFFEDQSAAGLITAVNDFEKKTFLQDDLLARANEFSKEEFKKKIFKKIEEVLK